MGKTFIGVRDVDEETFRKFRGLSVAEKMKLGEALTRAMKRSLIERKIEGKNKPNVKNLLKLNGIVKTKKKVRWSEEVDQILYS